MVQSNDFGKLMQLSAYHRKQEDAKKITPTPKPKNKK